MFIGWFKLFLFGGACELAVHWSNITDHAWTPRILGKKFIYENSRKWKIKIATYIIYVIIALDILCSLLGLSVWARFSSLTDLRYGEVSSPRKKKLLYNFFYYYLFFVCILRMILMDKYPCLKSLNSPLLLLLVSVAYLNPNSVSNIFLKNFGHAYIFLLPTALASTTFLLPCAPLQLRSQSLPLFPSLIGHRPTHPQTVNPPEAFTTPPALSNSWSPKLTNYIQIWGTILIFIHNYILL